MCAHVGPDALNQDGLHTRGGERLCTDDMPASSELHARQGHAYLLLKKFLEILNDKDVKSVLCQLICQGSEKKSATLLREPIEPYCLASVALIARPPGKLRGWEAVGRAVEMIVRHSSLDSSSVRWRCEATAVARDAGRPHISSGSWSISRTGHFQS